MCRNHQANKCQLTGHGQVQQRLQGPFVLSTAEEEQFDLGQSCFPSDCGSVLHQGQSVAVPRDSHGDLRTLTRGSKGLMHIKCQEHRDPPPKLGLWCVGSSLILSLSQYLVALGDRGMCDRACWSPALSFAPCLPFLGCYMHQSLCLSGDSKAFSHSNFLENS